LKALGLYENTVIIFTSDNGPHREGGADPDYFNSNGELRGHKRDLYEGGIRVPLIIHWPAKIRPGKTNIASAFWDFLPTISELIAADLPKNTDGISLCPTLFGKPDEQRKHPYLYWEFHELGGRQAIRKGKWKAIRLGVNTPDKSTVELYNIEDDIAEEHDLGNVYPDTLRILGTLMDNARSTNAVFKFKGEKNGN
jgi:arylsulfatase A